MCGITGVFDPQLSISQDNLHAIIAHMTNTLHHRGPDDSGVWVDEQAGIALGHRRLSILDLSSDGNQPMLSADGRFVFVFNGEIYNFQRLRKELEALGHRFRGGSDTEVMLAAFSQWGIEASLKRFVGMFAFGLWDRETHTLTLARDRLGEKPLYYGWMNNIFLFGSELKALRAYPGWEGIIDHNVLALFMRFSYVPAPYSIYQGIRKLLPGTSLTLPNHATPGFYPDPVAYWSAKQIAEEIFANPFCGSDEEAIENLEHLLRQSITHQMVADVPIGAFLSGGIDSSTVVALMQAQNRHPVKTFTIGFHESAYNEALYAKDVARYLGTNHTELYVTPEETMAVIPRLPVIYDEPFSDSSQIPTFLVSEMTRRHVTVSLSGDGGDELFGGYSRYRVALDMWHKFGWIPRKIRHTLAYAATSLSVDILDSLVGWIAPALGRYGQMGSIGEKIHKAAESFRSETPDDIFYQLISWHKNPASLVHHSQEPSVLVTNRCQWPDLTDYLQRMMYLDSVTVLPDDMLVKVDRAAMGVSLETRVPLLDHRVVEFSWSLPSHFKIRDGESKWILRQVLERYIPRNLVQRPKAGFGIPIGIWLRGPLREWAEALLNEQRLQQEGFLNVSSVQIIWNEHLAGRRNWQHVLWSVLMFQSWLENQAKGKQ